MLVLTRKAGEKIFILGDQIKIIYLGQKEGEAKIGIVAPKNIPIFREELWKKLFTNPHQF